MKISTNVKNKIREIIARVLILCMIAGNPCSAYAATQQAVAVSVKVLRSDGIVELRNSTGRVLPVVEGMRLYHGYQITTQEASYAYMALDETKLATLDAVSDMEVERKDGDLALMLNSGKMFFDVSAKLGEEETLNIHTSNVVLGIRGTSGLVEIVDPRHTRVWLFDGQIDGVVTNQINGEKKEIHMMPGMMVDFYVYNMDHAGDKCDIIVRNYEAGEAPGFVLREMKKNPELAERIKRSGGGDFSLYLQRAEERLQEDEARMHERMEQIRQAYEGQPYLNHTIPVFPEEDVSQNQDGGSESGGNSNHTGALTPEDYEKPGEPVSPEDPDPAGPEDPAGSDEPEEPAAPEDPADPEEPTEPEVYENATLISGSQINQKFQELLNYADSYGKAWNPFRIDAYAGIADLKAICYAKEAPSSDQYTVTLEASGSPVYAWYQSGTIYLYSDAPKIQFPADSSGLLKGFYSLTDISGLEKIDTANVTNLSNAFSTLRSLTDFSPISGWDVSNVTDLSYAFSGCTSMTGLSDLSTWDIGQVTDLSYAFAYDTALASVSGIKDWDTSSVAVLDNIFSGCTGLTDASSLSVHDAGSYMAWDVKSVLKNAGKAEQFINTGVAADTSYSGYPDWFMKTYSFIGDDGTTEIYAASIPMDAVDLNAALQNQLAEQAPEYLKNWNTSEDGSGTVLGDSGDASLITEDMRFYYQPLLATLLPGPQLHEKIKSATGGGSVEAILWSNDPPEDSVTDQYTISEDGSDRDIVCWSVYENGSRVLYLYGAVKTVYLNPDSSEAFSAFDWLSDISGLAKLDSSKVTDLTYTFANSFRLTDLSPIKNWDTSQVTSLDSTFLNLDRMGDYDALAEWDTGNVTSMNNTFAGHTCKDFLGLKNWDTGNVKSFQGTFTTTAYLNTFSDIEAFSGWDTSSAKTMRTMFNGCDSVQNVNGLSGWDVSNVTDMSRMFGDCTNLTDISGFEGWDTSNVQDMSRVFESCTMLSDLSALQNWDVESVTTMDHMFYSDTNLRNLEALADWNLTSCTDFTQMFDYCDAIKDASCLENWKLNGDAKVSWLFDSSVSILPWWYKNGRLLSEQVSTLTLDADPGTVELYDIAPTSAVTFYTAPQQMSEEVPDPEILEDKYIVDAVELPAAEWESAVFESWNTNPDGSGVSYEAGEVFVLDGEITLYAVWNDPSDAAKAGATLSNATLSNATPSDATPSDATPSDATPSDATPSNAAPLDAAPMNMTSPEDTLPDAISSEDPPLNAEQFDAEQSNAVQSNAVHSNAASAESSLPKATPSDAAADPASSEPSKPDIPRDALSPAEEGGISLALPHPGNQNGKKGEKDGET